MEDIGKFYLSRHLIDELNSAARLSFKSNVENIETKMNKARLLGYDVRSIDYHEKEDYIVKNRDSITLYSEYQIALPNDCKELFAYTRFTGIDLNDVDTTEVETLTGWFANMGLYGRVDEVVLSDLNMKALYKADILFSYSIINRLRLSNLYMPRLFAADFAFTYSNISRLEITNIEAESLYNITKHFKLAKIGRLDINNVDIRRVQLIDRLFYESNIKELHIEKVRDDMIKIQDKKGVFDYSNIEKLETPDRYLKYIMSKRQA